MKAVEYPISFAILVVQLARTFFMLSMLNSLVSVVSSRREQKESIRKKSCEKNGWKVGLVYANIMQTYKVHTRTSIDIHIYICFNSSRLILSRIYVYIDILLYFSPLFRILDWFRLSSPLPHSLCGCNNNINALGWSLYLIPHVWNLFKLFELNPLKNEYTIHVKR